MAARLRHNRTGLFDWLQYLDRRVRRFTAAESFYEYKSLFVFARYTRLRPAGFRKKPLDKALRDAGLEWTAQLLSECGRRIATRAEGALRDLTLDQRLQLAALLIDIQDEIENFNGRKHARDWSIRVRRDGRALQRLIPQNLKDARDSLRMLASRGSRYAEIDAAVGTSYKKVAEDALRELRELPKIKTRSFEVFPGLSQELRNTTKNPVPSAMAQLYWFFHSGCQLSGPESQLRVAWLRNGLWTEFGVEQVTFVDDDSDPLKGCRAVYQAVARFRPAKNTSR